MRAPAAYAGLLALTLMASTVAADRLEVKALEEHTTASGARHATFALVHEGKVVGLVERVQLGRRFGPPDSGARAAPTDLHQRVMQLIVALEDVWNAMRLEMMGGRPCPLARQAAMARLQMAAAANAAAGGELVVADPSGELAVADPGGELAVADLSGEFAVADPGSELVVAASGGELAVADPGGELAVADLSGELAVADPGGELVFVASGGELAVAASGGELAVAASGGELAVADPGGELAVATAAVPHHSVQHRPSRVRGPPQPTAQEGPGGDDLVDFPRAQALLWGDVPDGAEEAPEEEDAAPAHGGWRMHMARRGMPCKGPGCPDPDPQHRPEMRHWRDANGFMHHELTHPHMPQELLRPLLPGVGTPAHLMKGRVWTELQGTAQPAPPAQPPSWQLWDGEGRLNASLVAFVGLAVSCVAVWGAMLSQWRRYRSARDNNDAAEVLAQYYTAVPAEDAEGDLKPLAREEFVKA